MTQTGKDPTATVDEDIERTWREMEPLRGIDTAKIVETVFGDAGKPRAWWHRLLFWRR